MKTFQEFLGISHKHVMEMGPIVLRSEASIQLVSAVVNDMVVSRNISWAASARKIFSPEACLSSGFGSLEQGVSRNEGGESTEVAIGCP